MHETQHDTGAAGGDPTGPVHHRAVVTVPNALCVVRMLGTLVLLELARRGHGAVFPWILGPVILTDWLDGRLAVLLDQRTVLGARLDSIADAFLNASLVLCAWWLQPDFIRAAFWTLAATGATYLLSVATSLVRFGRVPGYHTWSAKVACVCIAVGAIVLFAGGPYWPCGVGLVVGIVANLEETVISMMLARDRTDVPSVIHAIRRARR